MAALVDMKRTPTDKKAEEKEWKTGYAGEDYPYGLKITLGNDELEKLGNPKFDMEAGGTLAAKFFVCSQTENTVNGKTKRNVTLELRQIAIEAKAATDAEKADKLYGKK